MSKESKKNYEKVMASLRLPSIYPAPPPEIKLSKQWLTRSFPSQNDKKKFSDRRGVLETTDLRDGEPTYF